MSSSTKLEAAGRQMGDSVVVAMDVSVLVDRPDDVPSRTRIPKQGHS